MAKLTVDAFLDKVRLSGLIEHVQLERAIAELKERAGDEPAEDDAEAFAEKLVETGLLSSWQCEKLLAGKHRGFFLGKYKLLALLGTGGMSSVYLAEHVLMQRRVAIKVLPKDRVEDSSYLARFHREAQAAAALDHRNIVRAYDVDNEDNVHYLVMEYVEGRDLQAMVKADGPMEYATAVGYIRQAAEGLAHAHQAGLIHRDVKPANLLVDLHNVVKVLDLGLARFAGEDKASLTVAYNENVLGTADYLAPEQALDSHGVDIRADIYSLGCALYYLLAGHPPYPDGTLPQRLVAHQKEPAPDIRTKRADAPADLVEINTKMMAKKAKHRYQTMGEVADTLARWLVAHDVAVDVGSGSGSSRLAAAVPGVEAARKAGGPPTAARPAKPPRRSASDPASSGRLPGLPDRDAATTDTSPHLDRPTVKGPVSKMPVRNMPEEFPGVQSDPSSPGPAPLPQADRLEDSSPSLFNIRTQGSPAVARIRARNPMTGDQIQAYRHRRKGTPIWLWAGIAAGALLAVVLAIVAMVSR
ncbi:MAG: protein kinase [Candidatus Nealsonbacteria bacterium]|nr:protein kinase [Candidatus Nealsonbacteria bacterium]